MEPLDSQNGAMNKIIEQQSPNMDPNIARRASKSSQGFQKRAHDLKNASPKWPPPPISIALGSNIEPLTAKMAQMGHRGVQDGPNPESK